MEKSEGSRHRLRAPTNMAWAPRPGWATVRLVGTCADRSLRRGQIVLHNPSDDYDVLPGQDEGLPSGSMVIILAEAARLVEDDFHLVPEHAIVAVGESLP